LGKKKREHFVPRAYLRSFGETLHVFDRLAGKTFSNSVRNLGLESGFYDLEPKIDLEGLIAENESRLRRGILELLKKRNPSDISVDSRMRISLFVALQWVRTREYREMIKESGSKVLTDLLNREPKFRRSGIRAYMKEELAQALQAQALVDDTVPKAAWFLGKSLWTLAINPTKTPFWTSDNPVVQFNPLMGEAMGSIGFNVRGIQTHVPLTRELLLLFLDPTSYLTPPTITFEEDQVDFENELQIYNSTRFIYSSSRDFSRATALWAKHPELQKPRVRVVVSGIAFQGRSFIRVSKVPLGLSGQAGIVAGRRSHHGQHTGRLGEEGG
jgi:hypothetical protein